MHRYTIIGQVGDGSFGVVSKACHTTTGEVVAVKKMKQRFNSWEECLQLREIQSLRRLQHPNVIKLKEVVRENTELFMIFELMDLNVYQITRMRSEQMGSVQNIFNDKEVRSIMCQTLLGLSAIHKGGFMHRDLKPENLLTKGDVVKIADFGLAKEIRSRPPFTEYVSTRWYRAPEIILRSTHYNSPIDIWACGVIFVELYLNRPLFPGASDPDQLFKICSILGPPNPQEWDEGYQLARRLNIRFPPMAPTPLRQIIQNAPPLAIDLIEQMLRFNPSDRPTASMCLQHPFFTGASVPGPAAQEHSFMMSQNNNYPHNGTSIPQNLYAGISSGNPHNPFLLAAATTAAAPTTTGGPQRAANSPTPAGQFGVPGRQGGGSYGPPSPTQQTPFFGSTPSSYNSLLSRPSQQQQQQTQQNQPQMTSRGTTSSAAFDEFQY
jgi:protein kinase